MPLSKYRAGGRLTRHPGMPTDSQLRYSPLHFVFAFDWLCLLVTTLWAQRGHPQRVGSVCHSGVSEYSRYMPCHGICNVPAVRTVLVICLFSYMVPHIVSQE